MKTDFNNQSNNQAMNEETKIIAYKGFDKNMKCRGFQYEVGKEYECGGKIRACENGFHACENPLDVFGYYQPADSRYCEVEQSGDTDRDGKDSKIASGKIRIIHEIGLKGIIEAGVKHILDKSDKTNDKATNTGNRSAATNTGDWSAATNTGDQSAATNTGDCSAATNTGDRSAASVEGKESVAIVTGFDSKASGAAGCWIVLTERGEWDGETYPIKEVKAFKVDGEKIKPGVFYKLIDGEAVEAE